MGLDCVFFAMAQTPSVVRFGVARRGGGRASGVAGMARDAALPAAAASALFSRVPVRARLLKTRTALYCGSKAGSTMNGRDARGLSSLLAKGGRAGQWRE